MIGKIALLLLFVCCAWGARAQEADTVKNVDVDYFSPRTYELAGVRVTGVDGHYDGETLAGLAGLNVGMTIQVPGETITRAIKRLYGQGIFSDVTISVDKVVGDKVYLLINLKERHRLSQVNYIGLKKSEETKVKESVNLQVATQVTDNMKANLKRVVERLLKEKGYYNTDIRIVQRDDPRQENHVILDVIVEKHSKIKIDEIIITGNEEIKDRQLKAAMKKTKEKSLMNFFKSAKYIEANYDEDKYNLVNRYNEKGYRDAVILSDSVVQVSPKRVKIYINVEEGNKYYFGDIVWVGNTVYDADVLSRVLNIRKGDVYNTTYLQERLTTDDDAVSNLYQNNGYLFSRLMPVETIVGDDSIRLEVRVVEGPQATVNKVIIKGNTRTHEHVIRRELYVYPGELFSREDIIRSARELANMGHFDPEQIKPDLTNVNPDAGTTDVVFSLVEKANDRVELSGGWGAGMIIGSVGLTFSNFSIRNIFNWDSYRPLPMGDGQTFSLKAQTNGKYYTSFSISFREPWLGGRKPNSLSASIYFSRQTGYTSSYNKSYATQIGSSSAYEGMDQSMLTFGASLGLGRRIKWPDDWFTLYTEISYQHYNLQNWRYYVIDNGKVNNLSFAAVLKRSSIDNPLFTRSGSEFSLSVAFTLPYSLFTSRDLETETNEEKYRWIEYHKWKFSGKIFMPLTRSEKHPLILYAGAQYGYLGFYNKYRRSPFEGFEMGGDGMSGYSLYGREYVGLRGYENSSLTNAGSSFIPVKSQDANLYSKLTLELRFPISLAQSATIYALAFLEAGNSWYALKDFEPFNLYRSGGVGLRVFLPMFGLLGIDWGYGFDDVQGRQGAGGSQFHFVLGQEF